jgi:hypothetical protein
MNFGNNGINNKTRKYEDNSRILIKKCGRWSCIPTIPHKPLYRHVGTDKQLWTAYQERPPDRSVNLIPMESVTRYLLGKPPSTHIPTDTRARTRHPFKIGVHIPTYIYGSRFRIPWQFYTICREVQQMVIEDRSTDINRNLQNEIQSVKFK